MRATPFASYRQTQAQTASRTQLVVMLYEGIIRFCMAAEVAARAGDTQGRHDNLLRAQAILTELHCSLDHEQGGELAANLAKLYDYCYRQLVEANVKRDAATIAQVRGLIVELLPAWRATSRQEQAAMTTPRSAGVAL